eukprot:233764_1
MSLVLLSTLLLSVKSSSHKWEYDELNNNHSHWVDYYPECGYDRQSPIDVTFKDTASTPYQCGEPLLLQFTSEKEHFAIRNTGHSLQAVPLEIQHEGGSELSGLEVLHHTNDTNIRLTNSFYNTYKSTVNKEFCFHSLHFHWAETDEYGSEHALNGELYPLELHLVHYSCDYRMASDAQRAYSSGEATEKYDDDNVLGVIGVLFEIGEANPVLDQILNEFVVDKVRFYEEASDYDNRIELYYTEFDLMDLLPSNKEMMAYLGSLTTPPCYETVRWHVMKQPMTVSLEQMTKFRMILESTDLDDQMAPNWRPLQDIGDRILYQCQDAVDVEAVQKDLVPSPSIVEEVSNTHDGEEEHDHLDGVFHLEMEGGNNILWIVIGVALIVICYLTYLIHCKSESSSHPGSNKNPRKIRVFTEESSACALTHHDISAI